MKLYSLVKGVMQPFIPPPNSKKIKAAEAEIYSLSVASIDQALKRLDPTFPMMQCSLSLSLLLPYGNFFHFQHLQFAM